MSVLGGAHFLARRFDEAMPKLLLAIQDDPSNPAAYRWLAACYAHLGRLDDAREIIARLRSVASVVVSDISHIRKPADRELILSGLRMATDQEV
jgi:tetratricopeptide (TPR) repeat protein